MIIKNICNRIEFNFFFFLIAFLIVLTGHFKEFLLFMSLLIVHECGHIFVGLFFKWNIEKVVLFPFGALTVFKDHLNKPIKEEFLIVIMGPIFQCICYFVLSRYFDVKEFHYGLLFFNLLPVIPLDGSKLVLLFYQSFFSYWNSTYFLCLISFFCFPAIFFLFDHSLVLGFMAFTLITKGIKLFQERHQLFSKFLLERFLYTFSFPKRKIILGNRVKKMKRDTKHLFVIENKYYTERQVLQKIFDFKRNQW